MNKLRLPFILTTLLWVVALLLYPSSATSEQPRKGLIKAGKHDLALTTTEKEYLNRKNQITMCIDPDWKPYEEIDKNGNHIGLTADYFEVYQRMIGIPVQLVKTRNWDESIQFAKARKCDILSLLNKSPERSEYLNFTEPYIRTSVVLVARDNVVYLDGLDSLSGKTLAIVKNYVYEEIIGKSHPEVEIISVKDIAEGLQKVSDGKVYAAIGSLLPILPQIQELGLTNLKIAGPTNLKNKFRIGVRNDDAALLSIFDKAVKAMDKETENQILQRWYTVSVEESFDYTRLWQILAVTVLILLTILYSNRKLAALNRKAIASENLLRATLESTKEGILVVNDAGQVTHLNTRFRTMWRIPEKILSTRDDEKIIESVMVLLSDPQTFISRVQELYKSKETGSDLIALKDGRTFERCSLPLMQKNSISGRVWSFEDITERKKAESDLLRARDQAENATKLKDQFVSLVSHDLRSPLSGIMSTLKILSEQKENQLSDDQRNKAIDLAYQSSSNLYDFIEKLLDVSRLRTGDIKPRMKIVKTRACVESLMTRFAPLAANKEIMLANLMPEEHTLFGDEKLLTEVISNLLSNAVKFCSAGDSISVIAPEGSSGSLAVVDNGSGISEAFLPNLFKHEVKTTDVGSKGETGTGFGLPYSIEIIRTHRGDLTVDSVEGKGSTFTIKLPHPETFILIVDDQPAHREIMKEMIQNVCNAGITEAYNGAEALSILDGYMPNLIITDLNMPETDGFELIKNIRSIKQFKKVPIIAASSLDWLEEGAHGNTKKEVMELGANAFITKPVNRSEFEELVSSYIS